MRIFIIKSFIIVAKKSKLYCQFIKNLKLFIKKLLIAIKNKLN